MASPATTLGAPYFQRTWAEISLDALSANARTARRLAGPGSRIMAVLKADAYGHGFTRVAEALRGHADFFGVANATEANEIAEALGYEEGNAEGSRPPLPGVLLLGANLPEERAACVANGWHVTVSTLEEARDYSKLAGNLRRQALLHLSVDTGMGRIGFAEADFPAAIDAVTRLPHTVVAGLTSHLPCADEDHAFTAEQLERVSQLFRKGAQRLHHKPLLHVHNSAGLLRFPPTAPCLIRAGLMIYGVAPEAEHQKRLSPVMSLKTRITLLRRLPPGRSVSYGRTFVTQHTALVATLGIGYGDGYPRRLSGRDASVLVGGRRCPLLGRVTMDQIMVDVTELGDGVSVGDEAVGFGRQGAEEIPVREIAEKADTIPWEILTGITRRVPRVYGENTGIDASPK